MTWPGMMDAILAAPYHCVLTQSFGFMSKQVTQNIMTRLRHARLVGPGQGTAGRYAMTPKTTVTPKMAQRVLKNCMCLRVQRASRVVGRMFDDAFRPLGLNNFQLSLLMLLNRPISPTIGGLAADLSMDRTTITANLKPLERRGLLTVRRDSKDARIKFVALTAAGRILLAECMPRWQAANASARAILDKLNLQSFYSDLDHIAASSS